MSARYELLELLGEGGMGRVHRARHHPSGALVAIKTLRAEWRDDPDRRRLFLDEATAAARLDDPRIVRLLDLGADARGAPFLVMELVDGEDLESWLARWPGWEAVARVLLDVLEGLSVAHAAGIVHRDLKPANVLVERDNGRARILDFGVAALFDPLAEGSTLRIAGTPEFMAPEQLLGARPTGPWTDLYAFGVMLAFVLTGRSPFEDAADLPTLASLKQRPAVLPASRPGLEVPRALRWLAERLLAPEPRDRPRFAAEVRSELVDASAALRDAVPRAQRSEPRRPSADTTLDPAYEATRQIALPEPAAVLPAPADLSLGQSLSRLREIELVGREAERELLESTIATVLAEGGAHALFFVGEAGIGKSRLARWGLAEVERTGAMEGAAGGYDATGSGAAGGLRHALGRLLGAPPPRGSASKPDPALEAWRWLAALATSRSSRPPRGSDPGEAELDLALLGRFVRADVGQETSSAEAIARTAHAALRAFGRMRPIYLWLDDVAWSNDGALPLIERLLDTNDTPIVVVGTLRTAARAASPQLERLLRHPRASTRTLGGLDPTALTTLAERTLPLAPGVAEVIAGQMPSSPLLLVSALREWMERGVLVPGPEGYALADAHVEASSLSHLLSRRLERFAASFGSEALLAEEVMVRAALLGARFERSALRASTSQRPELHAIVERVLDHALVLGILRADAGELWSFEHGLLHEDVLARDVVDGREARIDVANALHERYGRERADVAFHVAHLLHEAGLSDHAWARLFVAIERAAWAGDDAAALRALASAERWSEADPSQRGRVALARARVHYYALRYDEALPACEACVRAAREAGDVTLALRARTMFADLAYYRDCFATARAVVLEVMAALDHDDPDHAAIASACAHRLGDLEIVRGDLAAALAHRERVVELAREAQQSWRVRITQLNVAELLVAMGRADEARTLAEQCAADAREEQDADGLEAAHDALRHIAILTGDAASGRATNVQQILRAEAHRDLWRLTAALLEEAVASALLDPPSEVGPAVEAFLQAFRRVPHHDGFAVYGFDLLERTLETRELGALAASVRELRLERRAQLAAGFSR